MWKFVMYERLLSDKALQSQPVEYCSYYVQWEFIPPAIGVGRLK